MAGGSAPVAADEHDPGAGDSGGDLLTTLGGFGVWRDGRLVPLEAAPERPRPPAATLRFAWRGRACRATLSDPRTVALAADAGRVPSTATDAPARGAALSAALAAALRGDLPGGGPALPEGWRVRLTPDHRVALEAGASLPGPATAPNLVAAMVRFAMALDPYLERLDAAGLGRDGAAA